MASWGFELLRQFRREKDGYTPMVKLTFGIVCQWQEPKRLGPRSQSGLKRRHFMENKNKRRRAGAITGRRAS